MSASRTRRIVALITMLAIAGTLAGCGRYGKPVRPVPTGDPFAAVVRS